MCVQTKTVATLALLLFLSTKAAAAPGLDVTGRVVDFAGHPLGGVTIMVYHAGVLNGYSTLCPSCYRDCGKRVKSDASGDYTINNLQPGLWFDLLIVREGYAPEILKIKQTSPGTTPTAKLRPRTSATKPSHVGRGHVIDANGSPVREAVVSAMGVEDDHGSMIGEIPGLDPLAVTDENGNFDLIYERPATRMLVKVEARTLALKFATLVTGSQRQTIELSRGSTIRGRLVQQGKPVGNAEIGLIGKERGGFGQAFAVFGNPYPEMTVGTQQDGSFFISDVPTGAQWLVYAKMESVADRGASEVRTCLTQKPAEILDVGQIQLAPGYHLQGKLVLSDGRSVPDGMRIVIVSDQVLDFQTALLDKDGRFSFFGLPKGEYSISPAVKGYGLPSDQREIRVSVQQNVDNFLISLSPEPPTPRSRVG